MLCEFLKEVNHFCYNVTAIGMCYEIVTTGFYIHLTMIDSCVI